MKTKLFVIVAFCFLMFGCGDFVIFSLQEDIQLGAQVANQIESNPQEFPILKESEYPEAYGHLRRILNAVLASPEVKYREQFAYQQIKIIHNDEVLNAFATPGGYIYVYTGLIKYLDSEDHFAGVIGHEIAHAERRHSSKALQKQYGIQALIQIAAGNNAGDLAQIAGGLLQLKFGRNAEAEADDYSVLYLSNPRSPYQCNGAAGFFEKIQSEGGSRQPEFLSTHPSPENRVQDINSKAQEVGCSVQAQNSNSYEAFKKSLP